MTLNARFVLKCAQWTARLTYTFVAGFGFNHIRLGVARGGGGGVDWMASPPPCGQLTRCFSAVAELLVLFTYCSASAQLAIQSAVLAIVNLSLRLSVRCPPVCHTLALCQNDSSYDHPVFTLGQPHESSFLMVNSTSTQAAKAPIERGVAKISNFQRRIQGGPKKVSLIIFAITLSTAS